jgi:SAM-dependent methyltransferase
MTTTMACWGSPRTAAPGMLRGMGTHQAANRKAWTGMAPGYAEAAERQWAATEPTWGTVGRPERELGLLGDVRGLDVLELGCGTAYWSAWLQRRGARPIGLDVTPAQLATARRMQATHGQRFPLLEADGEAIPLRNGCVDLVVSEYGASIWCDPHRWVAEAARVLRPGGRLAYLVNAWLAVLCQDEVGGVSDRLRRDWRTPRRIEWADDGSIEFQRPAGEWITLLRGCGFEVERLEHLLADPDAEVHGLWVDSPDWPRRWPPEEVWLARLRG